MRKLDNFLVFFQYYALCKEELPMEVDFMLSDSLEVVRPNLSMPKSIEEAAKAVDDVFNTVMQNAGFTQESESGEESDDGDDSERPREEEDDDDDGSAAGQGSAEDERAPSPEPVVVLSAQEHLGPSQEADEEFAKELAKIITESSAESRKIDKKSAWWDTAVLGPGARKKRVDEAEQNVEGDADHPNGSVMNFTVITRRGNKQQTRNLAVPAETALAVHTRSAQLQDKVEQQHLKRLVLNYEQREEVEELKALETRSRAGQMKIRLAG